MAKNATSKPKKATAASRGVKSAAKVSTNKASGSRCSIKAAPRAKTQSAKQMDAGVIGYAQGSRFTDEEVRATIRRVLTQA